MRFFKMGFLPVLCLVTICVHAKETSAAKKPAEAMDAKGNVIAVWQEIDSHTKKSIIVTATKPVQGPWSIRRVLSNPQKHSHSARVVINEAGNAVVGWLQENLAPHITQFYAAMFLFGGAWTPSTSLSSTCENVISFEQFEINDSFPVTVTAIWTSILADTRFSAIRASSAVFGGTWSDPVTISSH